MDSVFEQSLLVVDPLRKHVTYLWATWQPTIEQHVDRLAGDLPQQYRDVLKNPTTYVAIAGLALLFFLFTFVSIIAPKRRRDVILIVGPCDAGKTTLFLQLREGSVVNGTVASMQANNDTFQLRSEKEQGMRTRPVHIVDIPGHLRVRGKYEEYIDQTCGIIFLVDAVDFLPHKTEIAELLIEILSNPVVSKRRLPILLACNKNDVTQAHTRDFIRKMLEREIEQLRSSRGTLDDGSRPLNIPLGRAGEPFSFEAHGRARGVKVSLTSVSTKSSSEIADIEDFIRKRTRA